MGGWRPTKLAQCAAPKIGGARRAARARLVHPGRGTRPRCVSFFPDLLSFAQVYLAKRGLNLPTYLGSVRCLWLRDLPTYSDPYLSSREWLPTYLLVLSRVNHVGRRCLWLQRWPRCRWRVRGSSSACGCCRTLASRATTSPSTKRALQRVMAMRCCAAWQGKCALPPDDDARAAAGVGMARASVSCGAGAPRCLGK